MVSISSMNALVAAVKRELREIPGVLTGKSIEQPRPPLAFAQLSEGLPRGALIEMSGPAGCGKTEALLSLLSQNSAERVAWVEADFTIYPCRFPQSKGGLDRVLFVEAERGQVLW